MKQLVVAINCPKGGAGKSTISKELAAAYSLSNMNGEKPSICIVDANIYFGDINSMLKLAPSTGMSDWAKKIKKDNLDEIEFVYPFEEIDSYLIQHGMGIYVLPAPSSTELASEISYGVMKTMIKTLKEYFDIIILDTGNNIDDCTIACYEQANKILLVITDDTTSIISTTTAFHVFERLKISMDKIELILNKYEVKKANRYFSIEEIEESVGGIYSVISYENDLYKINSSGIPAMMGKDTQFKKDIISLAKKLIPDLNEKDFKKKKG